MKGRARTLATEPLQKSSTMVRENLRNGGLQTTNLNAPRTRTAAANAGVHANRRLGAGRLLPLLAKPLASTRRCIMKLMKYHWREQLKM